MKRVLGLSMAFLVLFGLSPAANAFTTNTNFIATADNQYTSPYYATIANFDGPLPAGWSLAGSYAIVTGSVSGKYAAPAGVTGVQEGTSYITVPGPSTNGNGFVEVTGLPTSNYFGLWWGSIDTYNTFSFTKDGIATGESVTGSDVLGLGTPSGDQLAAGSNHYVNFLGLQDYNGFIMSSSQFAFEADNVAIGYNPPRVPEPTTLLFLGLGLLGVAGAKRKFKN